MNVIVLDTEAAPIVKTEGVQPELMRVYDLGWVVVDTNDGHEVDSGNVAILDTFKNAQIMSNAYYCDKLPQYYSMMHLGTLHQVSFKQARDLFKSACKEYHIKQAWAYNCRFDYATLNATLEDYSGGYQKLFMPYGVKLYDIMSASATTVCATKKYTAWAKSKGLVTAKGTPRMTAEAVYRYVTGNHDFIESHTALDDSRIEARILWECMRRHGGHVKAGAKWGTKLKAPKKQK